MTTGRAVRRRTSASCGCTNLVDLPLRGTDVAAAPPFAVLCLAPRLVPTPTWTVTAALWQTRAEPAADSLCTRCGTLVRPETACDRRQPCGGGCHLRPHCVSERPLIAGTRSFTEWIRVRRACFRFVPSRLRFGPQRGRAVRDRAPGEPISKRPRGAARRASARCSVGGHHRESGRVRASQTLLWTCAPNYTVRRPHP